MYFLPQQKKKEWKEEGKGRKEEEKKEWTPGIPQPGLQGILSVSQVENKPRVCHVYSRVTQSGMVLPSGCF